jgi:hypothetical protein
VFPAAIAASAYNPVVPPRSLHVATSFNMIGWLDSLPDAPLPRFIQPNGPREASERVSVSEAESKPFRVQADADLRNFYRRRAEELLPGGKLLLQVFGRNDAHSTSHGIYDVLSDALLGLIDDSELPREFYEKLVIPVYCRTAHELTSALESDIDLAKAFRVEKVDACEVSVPFNEVLAQTGDVQAWARSYTGFLRAITEPVLSRELPETIAVSQTVEKIYRRIERLLVANPSHYELHYISVATLLTRI